jgi:hypothetical protein
MNGIETIEIRVMIGLMGYIITRMIIAKKIALRIVPSHVLRNMSTN